MTATLHRSTCRSFHSMDRVRYPLLVYDLMRSWLIAPAIFVPMWIKLLEGHHAIVLENGSASVRDKSCPLRSIVKTSFEDDGADTVSLFVNGISVWAIGPEDVQDDALTAELLQRSDVTLILQTSISRGPFCASTARLWRPFRHGHISWLTTCGKQASLQVSYLWILLRCQALRPSGPSCGQGVPAGWKQLASPNAP